MKKNRISFESIFWAGHEIKSSSQVLEAFFDFAHLDCYKEILCEAFLYVHKKKVYKKDYPGQVIVFYTALRSFLKVCFLLQYKNKKWKLKNSSDCKSNRAFAFKILDTNFTNLHKLIMNRKIINTNLLYI